MSFLRQAQLGAGIRETKMQKEVQYWRSKYEDERLEKEFFHKSALGTKRKYQLLKFAIKKQ